MSDFSEQREVHRRIAVRLAEQVAPGGAAWADAPPYLRRHLAAHASTGGVLERIAADVGFLGSAEPERLLPELLPLVDADDSQVAAAARAYVRLGLGRVGPDFVQRVANLLSDISTHSPAGRPRSAVDDAFAAILPWTPRFSVGRSESAQFVAPAEPRDVTALTVVESDVDVDLLVVADARALLSAVNPSDGAVRWSRPLPFGRTFALTTIRRDDDEPALVSGSLDGTIASWDVAQGDVTARAISPSPIVAITGYIEDGRVLCAVGCVDGAVRIFAALTGELVAQWPTHTDAVATVAHGFDSDGRVVIVSGGLDRAVVARHSDTGHTIMRATGPTGSILAVDVITDADRVLVAAGSADESVWMWDLDGSVPRDFHGHLAGVNAVRFVRTEAGLLLASASSDAAIVLWDASTGSALATLRGHLASVHALTCLGVGHRRMLVSAAADRTMRTWDLEAAVSTGGDDTPGAVVGALEVSRQYVTGRSLPPDRYRGQVRAVAVVAGDGRAGVASGSLDGFVQVRDDDGRLVQEWRAHRGGVLTLAALPVDGSRLLLSGGRDRTVRLWDVDTANQLWEWKHDWSVWGLASVHFEGRALAVSGGRDRKVRVQDLRSGETVWSFDGPEQRVWGVAIQAVNGRLLIAAGSTDRSVWLWDGVTGELVRRFRGAARGVRYVSFVEIDREWSIVASSANGVVYQWNLDDDLPPRTHEGHTDSVWGLAAVDLDDRPCLATASDDSSIRIWDLRTGSSVALPQPSPAYAVAVDRRRLFTATSEDLIAIDLGVALDQELDAAVRA